VDKCYKIFTAVASVNCFTTFAQVRNFNIIGHGHRQPAGMYGPPAERYDFRSDDNSQQQWQNLYYKNILMIMMSDACTIDVL